MTYLKVSFAQVGIVTGEAGGILATAWSAAAESYQVAVSIAERAKVMQTRTCFASPGYAGCGIPMVNFL